MLEVRLLGGFEVVRDDVALSIPDGKPKMLVKIVATAGGSVSDATAIEAIWPGSSPEAGRRGLRNVLHRLRSAAGEVLRREGTYLRLDPSTVIDFVRFDQLASEALRSPSGENAEFLAREALQAYGGELLPDDPDASWALLIRARLQELNVRLLDFLAARAEARGQLDDAIDFYDRAIEADPHDERRYLLAARILVSQGRQAKALHVLERGAVAMRSLGLPLPAAIATLSAKISKGKAMPEHFPEPVDLVYFPVTMPWHTTPLSRAGTMHG
jgi:DNA-binding SARP family transcriptional activator